MNKTQLIEQGLKIKKIVELSELKIQYEAWKENILYYVAKNTYMHEQCKIKLHIMDTPFESVEEKIQKYYSCIEQTIRIIDREENIQDIDAIETIIKNFDVYLQNMFHMMPENKATLQKEILDKIVINNEYDVQHIMYAVIKALYPSARREVNQDIGYGTVRYDIVIEEIDTVIEIKCTRKDHSENKLYRELGEDGYFYKCSRLIMYVYDKQNVISDVDNFIKTLSRTKETAGKNVKVYVEQRKDLV